jgi:hypothetical protein
MDEVNIQTGKVVISEEIDGRLNGRIYDVSPNDAAFAAVDTSNSSNGVFHTSVIDIKTRKILVSLSGTIDFLANEKKFLVDTSEIRSEGQLQLQENDSLVCTFSGIEYFRSYTRISRDHSTITSLTFNNRTFENSVQIWDIPSCKLLNTITLG